MSATLPTPNPAGDVNPLASLDQWDDFVEGRYSEGKSQDQFRIYDKQAQPGVAEFYRLNHENQTLDFVLGKEKEYFSLGKGMKDHLGSGGIPEHHGRRQRSRHRSDPDRAPAPDLRGHSPRQ